MFNNKDFVRAERIKGYGSYDKFVSYSEIEAVKTVRGEAPLKVKPTVIENLKDYIEFLSKIKTSFVNPVFFRGQNNANFLLTPNCLRVNPKNEHLMIEAFTRKFFDELNKYQSSMEKLVVMQHFQLPTRCLDISENPLMALYFACSHMKKFRTKIIKPEEENWGEIIIFQEPYEKDVKPEKLKSIESSNVSVIANTAYMEDDFSLWHLGARWKKDVDIGHDEKYIDLRSVVHRSYIVRVPHNNIRIKNQQGAFIMANANVAYIENCDKDSNRLTEEILKKDYINYYDLMDKGYDLIENNTWDLRFKKIKPYSEDNELSVFRTDPFDLKRLFYKERGYSR